MRALLDCVTVGLFFTELGRFLLTPPEQAVANWKAWLELLP